MKPTKRQLIKYNKYILRCECHILLDKLCENKEDKRKIYKWLSAKMQLSGSQCHFSMMTESQLYKARKILKSAEIKKRRKDVE